jgi:glucosyl-dolichyl phosphate glucuronosyltransferase
LSSNQTVKEILSFKSYQTKKVSVIISTYSIERFEYTCECIDSIRHQTLMPCEILLVLDPNSELINFYYSHQQEGVNLVISQSRGLSAARNIGIQNAQGEFVAFIDDDAVAKNDWLEVLVENCNDPSVIGVGGFVEPIWETGRPVWFPEEVDWAVGCSYAGLGNSRRSVRNPIGCNMLFRRDVFGKAGFFDNNIGRLGKHLMGSEETEFSIRALSIYNGSKIIYDPSAIVFHWVPRTRAHLSYLLRRSYYEGVSKSVMKGIVVKQNRALSTERNYITYIAKVGIVKRIKNLQTNTLMQLILLMCSTSLVVTGYLVTSFYKIFRTRKNLSGKL